MRVGDVLSVDSTAPCVEGAGSRRSVGSQDIGVCATVWPSAGVRVALQAARTDHTLPHAIGTRGGRGGGGGLGPGGGKKGGKGNRLNPSPLKETRLPFFG